MYLRDVRLQHWICLSVIILLALGARVFHLDKNSLWADEFLSLECSSGWARTDQNLAGQAMIAPDLITLKNARPWTTIWSSIAADENHPPLYFILLRGWRNLFGDSVIALRSLSVVSAIIGIVLLFAICVTVSGPRAGLWASLLMALSMPQIQQSQDARSYMLMITVCLAGALALVRIERFGPTWPRCVALCATALAAPLLHYMALATVGAMIIYAVFFLRERSRRLVLISLLLAVGLYTVLWGPAFVMQHYRMVDSTQWMVQTQGHPAHFTLRDLFTLPARAFLNLDLEQENAPGLWLAGGVFLLPLLLYRRHNGVMLWWIWFILPVAVLLVIDLSTGRRSLGMAKYTIAAAPAVFVMLGLLADQVKRVGWIPAAITVLCCAICLPSNFRPSPLVNWREMSTYITQRSKASDPVLFIDSHPDRDARSALLSVTYYLADQQHPLYVMDRRPAPAVLAQLLKCNHACVIADDCKALSTPVVPGFEIDQGELLPGMAVVGTIEPPSSKHAVVIARASR